MPQFSIHKNNNPASKNIYPLLINIQSSLLDSLETRLVIPLTLKANSYEKAIKDLNPVIKIDEKEYIMLTQQMAAIQLRNLGVQVSEGSLKRQEILSAIDLLITGF